MESHLKQRAEATALKHREQRRHQECGAEPSKPNRRQAKSQICCTDAYETRKPQEDDAEPSKPSLIQSKELGAESAESTAPMLSILNKETNLLH